MSCSSSACALEVLRRGDRLPVVGHQRALAQAQRHGCEGLRLPDQHLLVAAVGREAADPTRRQPGAARPPAARPARPRRAATVSSSPSSRGQLGGRDLAGADRDPLLRPLARRGLLLVAERLLEPAQRVAQLELAEHLAQARAVGLARERLVEVDVDVHVAHRGGQLLGHARVLGVVGQVLLALGAGDLVDARQHALQVAVLLQQLGGGLLADARDAGDVVRGVALQAGEVGDQLGRDPVAVDHRLAVVDLGLGDAARWWPSP